MHVNWVSSTQQPHGHCQCWHTTNGRRRGWRGWEWRRRKQLQGQLITWHYIVLAICITRWVIKGSNTVTLQLLRRLILLRKSVSTVHKNKLPLPNISQNNYQLCKKKCIMNFVTSTKPNTFGCLHFWLSIYFLLLIMQDNQDYTI